MLLSVSVASQMQNTISKLLTAQRDLTRPFLSNGSGARETSACGCVNRFAGHKGLSFFRFPVQPEMWRRWIAAVKRKDWEPKKHTRICGQHFTAGIII